MRIAIGEILLLLVLAGFAFGVVLRLRRKNAPVAGVGGADGASCGNCGYRVRGLTTFTCPECGSDLREVGMLPPRDVLKDRGAGRLIGRLVGFIGLWLLVGMFVARLAAAHLGKIYLLVWLMMLIGGQGLIVYLHLRAGRGDKALTSSEGA